MLPYIFKLVAHRSQLRKYESESCQVLSRTCVASSNLNSLTIANSENMGTDFQIKAVIVFDHVIKLEPGTVPLGL